MATLGRCVKLLLNNGVQRVLANNCILANIRQNSRTFSRFSVCLAEKRFSDKHEWVTVEGKIGTIGISDHAQDALGDIVYAQLPEDGEEFDQDDECGALESVKAASELYIPVSGTVVEKNAEVEESPGAINKDCYGKGWLFKVELSKPEELDDLMTEDKYMAFLKAQDE